MEPEQIDQLLHPMFDKDELEAANAVAGGLPASPGAACGKIYFTAGRMLLQRQKKVNKFFL